MKKPIFTGACTALVTPFLDEKLNTPMLRQLIRRQLNAGMDALVICGTTGESAALSDAEKLELFGGTTPTTFSPDLAMTRGMFVQVLSNLAKIDATEYAGKSKFTDVKEDDYFCASVNWAQKNGIVGGTSPPTFSPNENITREQTAVMMAQYMDYAKITLPETEVPAFADSDQVSAYAVKAVQKMHATGLMLGRGDNLFVPKGQSTRAEMATILVKFCDKIG